MTRHLIQRFTMLAVCVLSMGFSVERLFAPKAKLWDVWSEYDARSTDAVDHAVWNDFLGRYVVEHMGINRVDYGAVTPSDKQQLKDYIARLQGVAVGGLNREQQQAYWINLYNAKTVDIVLAHYPVASIRDIAIKGGGPWKAKLLSIQQQAVSLNDIEHRILRPLWQDPRIHYGLNCASIGCPNLQKVAFTAENSDALLDQAAQDYVNHPRAVTIVKEKKLRMSSIYNWFYKDFGGSKQDLLNHINRYANDDLKVQLRGIRKIGRYHYDWSLNDVPK